MTPPRRLRDAAIEYVAHGWPIAPVAVPTDTSCPCGGACEVMHLLDDHAGGISSDGDARKLWAEYPWQIAVVTVLFDVVDLPGTHGSTIHHRLKTRCPTATARPGRRLDWIVEPGPVRWHFYVTPGTADPERVAANDGVLRAGPTGWIPAPPSRTPDTGRVGWVVPPMQARWAPYRRTDIFDTLGLS